MANPRKASGGKKAAPQKPTATAKTTAAASKSQVSTGKKPAQKRATPATSHPPEQGEEQGPHPKQTRRSSRRVNTPFRGDRTTVDPSKIVKVPAARALPGENEPLRYGRGRGPISEHEALGVMRRRERSRMKDRLGLVDESEVTSEFPVWSAPKELSTFRMSPALKALSEALAEMEDVSWASFMELLVWERIQQPPRNPDEVRRALRTMLKETVGAEMLDREFGV